VAHRPGALKDSQLSVLGTIAAMAGKVSTWGQAAPVAGSWKRRAAEGEGC